MIGQTIRRGDKRANEESEAEEDEAQTFVGLSVEVDVELRVILRWVREGRILYYWKETEATSTPIRMVSQREVERIAGLVRDGRQPPVVRADMMGES